MRRGVKLHFETRACCVAAALWMSACATPSPEPRSPSVGESRARTSEPVVPTEELSPERVLFALQPARREIRECLAEAGLKGALRVEWSVDTSGNARDFRFPEVSGAADTYACLTQIVGSRLFDASKSVTRASWTFVRQLPTAHGVQARTKHKSKGKRPVKRQGVTFDVAGRLTPAQVDDTVNGAFKLYAHCFREGIAENLHLNGRLLLRLNINQTGRVARVLDAGSELDNPTVIDCAAEAFYTFAFARPVGGPVQVTCPILFNQE
jgi:hypothetical protein